MRKSMKQILLKLWYWTKGRQPTRTPKSKPQESRWQVKARMKQINLSRGYLFPHTQKRS
jgi:hypothetical protein